MNYLNILCKQLLKNTVSNTRTYITQDKQTTLYKHSYYTHSTVYISLYYIYKEQQLTYLKISAKSKFLSINHISFMIKVTQTSNTFVFLRQQIYFLLPLLTKVTIRCNFDINYLYPLTKWYQNLVQ